MSLIKYCIAIILILPLACKHNIRNYSVPSSFKISVPAEIPLNKINISKQLQKRFNLHRKQKKLFAEIVILSYSSGKEIFSYSEKKSKNVEVKTLNGSIEAMIKIRDNDLLKEILFIKAVGSSKEEIINNFIHKLIEAFQ